MYEQHFNFSSPPFSIAPNPRFVYLSPQHREALAHLLFGISAGGGFVALTREVGTGKTTLCRCLLEQLPDDVDIALIFNPRLNAKELLAAICDELRIAHPAHRATIKQLIDLLNHHLLDAHARGRRTVVLIDEAQNLSYDVLEQVRLLTNLETNETKLLQIILVGQPELKALLGRPQLRQLSQRITARYHLKPLSLGDTDAYIRHRLAVSGVHLRLFTPSAVKQIYRRTGGIPRLINLICDRALLGAYALGQFEVTPGIVRKAAGEVLPEQSGQPSRVYTLAALSAVLALLAVAQHQGYLPLDELLAPDIPSKPKVAGAIRYAPAPTPVIVAVAPSPDPTVVPSASPEGVPTSSPNDVSPPSPTASARPVEASPPPTAVPAPPPDRPLAEVLNSLPAQRDQAMPRLLALWGTQAPAGGTDACTYARLQGLRCLEMTTAWPQLVALNRPALLELQPTEGARRFGLLVAAQTGPVLEVEGREVRPTVEELERYWHGAALILWKPPFGKSSARVGDKGETVRWIRDVLKMPAAAGAALVFDEKLKSRVAVFQKEQGLLQDGQVGPLTMINLEELDASLTGPRLGARKD